MDSRTKPRLDRPTLELLARTAFGDRCRVVNARELDGGFYNAVLEIALEGGPDGIPGTVILKVGPDAGVPVLTVEENIMRAEVESLRLAASDPELPVPRVLYAETEGETVPNAWIFMERVPGRSLESMKGGLADGEYDAIMERLGALTARINELSRTLYAPSVGSPATGTAAIGASSLSTRTDETGTGPSRLTPAFGLLASGVLYEGWSDAFASMAESLYADAERFSVPLPYRRDELSWFLAVNRDALEEVREPSLVHWDLWDGNIFVERRSCGLEITGLIDFERALLGDPLMELKCGFSPPDSSYWRGYGRYLLASGPARRRRLLYDLYLYTLMIVEDGPRQYPDKGTVRWASERIGPTLETLREYS